MPASEIVLRNGHLVHEEVGSFASYTPFISPSGGVEVKIFIKTDTESKRWYSVGENFSVRDQVWKLDRVENPGQDDWVAYLARVE